MKATPGPWTLEDRDVLSIRNATQYVGPFVIVDGDGVAIATIEDDGEPGEAQANALLIAASPDLYAAVEAALAQFDASIRGARPPLHDLKVYAPLLRAALAKAQGRNS